jgi:REase_DpnII-MboI
MDAEQTLAEVKRHETEFAAILSRFKSNRDGIWIGEGDDPILRQHVREIIDLFNEIFGKNGYSQQISDEFNNGITNFSGSPSFKSVENILSVIRAVLTRLNRNPQLLISNKATENGTGQTPVKAVLGICNRFHEVARQLLRRRENRATLEIKDEYDVQDLLHALLRIDFDDIRSEEWTPSYGGGSSRMDFLLKDHAIVVEVKMARKGLDAKEVSEQLIIDAAKYRQHQDCKTLVCFVYDSSALVKNPRGIERDMAKLSGSGLDVICVVRP